MDAGARDAEPGLPPAPPETGDLWLRHASLRDLFRTLLTRSILSMAATCALLLVGTGWSLYRTALQEREQALESRLVADAADIVVAHGPLVGRLERTLRRIETDLFAIARQLTELLGGTLTVESAVGRGITFRVTFDALEATAIDRPLVPGEETDRMTEFRALSVLYADDHELNRLLMSSYFEGGAHRLLLASDGGEAVEVARREDPDVIVLDLRVPVLDGVEALAQIRAFSRAPAMVLTASTAREVAELDAGFDRVLHKPIEPDELTAAIREVLQTRAETS